MEDHKVDLTTVIVYLEEIFNERMRALGDIREESKEKIYNELIAPYIAAVNILKAHGA